MREKEILVFRYRKGLRIGCLEEAENGGQDKLRVATKKSRAFSIPRENVLLACGVLAETQGELDQFRDRVAGLADAIDLREVWELVLEDGESLAFRDIAELYWDDLSDVSRSAALLCYLNSDACPYFAHGNDRYVPAERKTVEEYFERLERQERAAQEDASLDAWLRCEAEHPTPEEMTGRQRDWYDRLVSWVLQGDEWHRASSTRARFAELLGGKGNLRRHAFRLLVRRGMFDEDENLELLRLEVPVNAVPAAEAEAEQLDPSAIAAGDGGARLDLREVLVFSIDDAKTTDIDDALSVERTAAGYRIGIHVTDLSRSVPPGSALDETARQRLSTLYFPDRTIHMLPRALAEAAGSLIAGEERAAISLFVDLDRDLAPGHSELKATRLANRHQLTYETVNAVLERGSADAPEDLADALRILGRVAEASFRRRLEAGALSVDRPEAEIRVDDERHIHVDVRDKETAAHRLVSELMILYNVEAARFCQRSGLPIVYRTQSKVPDVEVPEGSHPAYRRYLLLKAAPPTQLKLEPAPHHMLGVDCYSQFTSPLRRLLDLIMQRQLAGYLLRGERTHDEEEISRLRQESAERMRDLRRLENARDRYWLLKYLKSLQGETFEVVVLEGRQRAGVVELTKYPIRANIAFSRPVQPGEVLPARLTHIDLWDGSIRLTQ